MLRRAVFGACALVLTVCVFRIVVAQCPYQKADNEAACPQSPWVDCPNTQSVIECLLHNAQYPNVGPFACKSNGENPTWCGNRCAVDYCTVWYPCCRGPGSKVPAAG